MVCSSLPPFAQLCTEFLCFVVLDYVLDLKLIRGQVWSAGKDCIHIWNVKKPAPVKKISFEKKDYCLCLLEVDEYVWGGSQSGVVRVYNQKGKLKRSAQYAGLIDCMLKRGTLVWLGTEAPIVQIRADTFEPTGKLTGHTATVSALQSVGPFHVWSCSLDHSVIAWNDLGEKLQIMQCDSKAFALLDVPSEQLVWVGCWGRTMYVYHSEQYECLQQVNTEHADAISAFVLDKQKQVWSSSYDGHISIWRHARPSSLIINN